MVRAGIIFEGTDRVITRTYHTQRATLAERLRHVFADSQAVTHEADTLISHLRPCHHSED